MPTAIVLGAGLIGSVIATDLAAEPGLAVVLADASSANLQRAAARAARLGLRVETRQVDLAAPGAVEGLVRPAGVVVGALASRVAFPVLRAVIEAGRPCCDISFMTEDPLALDALARARGVACVVDCGVAPGMSHILAADAAGRLARCAEAAIYVGGLPQERRWPFQYKAGFSPADVIEEYTRPVRLLVGGVEVVREALSEPELMDFPGVGTLEAFNTDGLRTLVRTLGARVPTLKEKTLRYPGHIELMRVFRATGLFSEEPIDVRTGAVAGSAAARAAVRPRDLLAALLFPQWTYEPGEADLTVMRVEAHGTDAAGRAARVAYDVLDRHDPATDTTSMARTTAFPAAIVARMLLSGRIDAAGVHPPEALAGMGVVDEILAEHARRGVHYRRTS